MGLDVLNQFGGLICMAASPLQDRNGEIDALELESFLDLTAGPHMWLMTSAWLFARAPSCLEPDRPSVPVIAPFEAANRIKMAAPSRVIAEHQVGEVELQGWRWVARQVHPKLESRFPWEVWNTSGRA